MPPSDGAVEVEASAFFYDSGATGSVSGRAVPVEAPVQIVIGGSPFAIMMATPQDLEDFAYGFALSEGVTQRVDEIRAVEVEKAEDGWRLKLALAGETLRAHLGRKRAMSGRTGCGLCGIDDFDQMPKPRPLAASARPVAPAAVGRALAELDGRQPLNALTHAVHAAAWCALDGQIVLVREDVGRHNALDKAIGALWRAGANPEEGFFVITSRCSFEMVAKAAIFGARTLVALSAPTSLALERAQAFGVTVIAVARLDKALSFDGVRDRGDGGKDTEDAGVTTGKLEKLARMANQIGDFYAAMPENEGTEGAASHLKRYWTPKMIEELTAFAETGRAGLNPTAARALEALKHAAAGA